MRLLIFVSWAGCVEYQLQPEAVHTAVCAATDDWAVCPGLVDFDEARRQCADLGATLLALPEPYTRDDVFDVVDVAVTVTSTAWWVGMPTDFDFECPAMTTTGAIVHHQCAELRGFACGF